MPVTELKKANKETIAVVKKMRDYSAESVFKKKAERAVTFLKEHCMPESFENRKK